MDLKSSMKSYYYFYYSRLKTICIKYFTCYLYKLGFSSLTNIKCQIGLVGRVFANDPGDLGSIPGRVIPMTLKMVLNTSLLITQQHKVRIKGKVEQSRERSSALPYTSV